ncbi:MAG: ABC transporter ATP-binding protein [Rhodocyclaceae bacterium]|jgi:phospholipid/cholesterol/gamma-HCH transport system ATP-binding protein
MADPQDTLIEISNLKFSYNSLDVLKGLDLAVPRGRIVAILGASGCGKTTLLRLIGGQLRPAAGHVRFDGQVIHELDTNGLYEVRRKMGMMFQQGGLFTDLSTFENIAFPMRERTDLPDALIHDMVLMKLHAVGLRGAHELMPSELSGGMARRVALSRAIAMDPMLIMYDEPFSGLDPISLTQIGNLIRGLNDALGVTSIVVTYDVAESLKVVDYAYFIADGKVVAQGTPDEIRASTDPFVRQFVDGLPDGPVAFHMAGKPLAEDLNLAG